MRALPLLLLLLIPTAFSLTAIYARNFSVDCYIYRTASEQLLPETPKILESYLEDMGFDVDVIEDTEDLRMYDALIVLSCTDMDPKNVEDILNFYDGGGGLIVDVHRENPITEALGVRKKTYPLEGLKRGSLSTLYVDIKNGVIVKETIKDGEGPIVSGYERMYYVGEPIYLPSGFNSGFAPESGEDVLGWKKDGGRVAVVGCLYCADPLLLANLVDWAEDGKVDFPRFLIKRRALPDVVPAGGTIVDEIEVVVEEGVQQVTGSYLFGTSGAYCNFELLSSEFERPQPFGDKYRLSARFTLRAGTEPETCYLPPALLEIFSGSSTRRVTVDPVEVVVSGRTMVQFTENDLPLIAGILVVFLLTLFVIKMMSRRQRLLREWRKYRFLIKVAKRKRMKREISQEAYERMMAEYEKALQEIEVELRMLGVRIPSEETTQGSEREGKQGRQG